MASVEAEATGAGRQITYRENMCPDTDRHFSLIGLVLIYCVSLRAAQQLLPPSNGGHVGAGHQWETED